MISKQKQFNKLILKQHFLTNSLIIICTQRKEPQMLIDEIIFEGKHLIVINFLNYLFFFSFFFFFLIKTTYF